MRITIYCQSTSHDVHSFYLTVNGEKYFLFSQNYRKGVHGFYSKGVLLNDAIDYSRAGRDIAIVRTMKKIRMYIKYIEKEYGIEVLNQTKRRNRFYMNDRKKYA